MFFEPELYKKTARKQILLLTQNYLANSKNFLANGTDIGKYAVLDKLTCEKIVLKIFNFILLYFKLKSNLVPTWF